MGALIGNALANRDETAQTRVVDAAAFDSMAAEEYQRGLYTQEEDPAKASVFIVYIDTLINGKRVFTRTIAPARSQGDQNALADAVELAIKNQLARYSNDGTKSNS